MTKLTKQMEKTLAGLNIVSKKGTEEDAKAIVLKKLKEEEIEGVEDTDLPDLVEMYSAFFEEPVIEDEEEAPKKKSTKKPAKKVVDDEDEDDEEDEPEYEEDDDEEDEDEAPKKKPAKKVVKKVVVEEDDDDEEDEDEEEDDDDDDEDEAPKKKSAKKVVKKVRISGERFDIENKAHKKLLLPFKEIFGDLKVEYKPISTGVSIHLPMKNANKLMLRFFNAKVVDGELRGNCGLIALRGVKDIQSLFEVEVEDYSGFFHFIKDVSVSELVEILNEEIIETMVKKLQGVDKKLGKNREKLEEKMKPAKKAAKKDDEDDEDEEETPKKKVVVEEDEDDEEEAPKKKSTKKPAKKVVDDEDEDDEDDDVEEEEVPKKKSKLSLKKGKR